MYPSRHGGALLDAAVGVNYTHSIVLPVTGGCRDLFSGFRQWAEHPKVFLQKGCLLLNRLCPFPIS